MWINLVDGACADEPMGSDRGVFATGIGEAHWSCQENDQLGRGKYRASLHSSLHLALMLWSAIEIGRTQELQFVHVHHGWSKQFQCTTPQEDVECKLVSHFCISSSPRIWCSFQATFLDVTLSFISLSIDGGRLPRSTFWIYSFCSFCTL